MCAVFAAEQLPLPIYPSMPDLSAFLAALNITPSDVIIVLALGIGICLSLCFAYWGARKLLRMFFTSAFRNGRLRF